MADPAGFWGDIASEFHWEKKVNISFNEGSSRSADRSDGSGRSGGSNRYGGSGDRLGGSGMLVP